MHLQDMDLSSLQVVMTAKQQQQQQQAENLPNPNQVEYQNMDLNLKR